MRLRRGAAFFLVLASVCAIAADSYVPGNEPAREPIRTALRGDYLELSWSDAEDRLQGSITPALPRAGEPMRIALDVGSYQGTPYRGPVVIALRRSGESAADSRTVAFDGKGWNAEFIPRDDGNYALDVSFRTTHYKALHCGLMVSEARLPRVILWVIVVAASLGALAYGIRLALKTNRAPPKPA
jgi:hypothetical protein